MTDLIKVNSKLVPVNLNPENGYSKKRKQQVLEMFKIYKNLVFYAGVVEGFGSELDAPDVGALETLLEIKKQADLLPPQIRKFDPKPFETIEEAIRYCQK